MLDLQRQADDILISRARVGCEESFTILYRRHQGRVFGFALQMSGSEAIAEEVTQDVFVTLAGSHTFDPAKGSLPAFLLGVARNCVLSSLRQANGYVPLTQENDAPGPQAVLNDLTRRETIGEVRRAVLSLPPNYREVVILCDLQELDYAEAAKIMNCGLGTLKSRLFRGRALLAEKLRPKSAGVRSARCLA